MVLLFHVTKSEWSEGPDVSRDDTWLFWNGLSFLHVTVLFPLCSQLPVLASPELAADPLRISHPTGSALSARASLVPVQAKGLAWHFDLTLFCYSVFFFFP